MSLNLNAEQRTAHSHAYRTIHHTRLYRLHQRADGAHVLVVKFEHPDHTGPIPRIAKAVLKGDVVSIESFDPAVSPHYRDDAHVAQCISRTLLAYQHPGLSLDRGFDLRDADESASSLPMLIPELLEVAV